LAVGNQFEAEVVADTELGRVVVVGIPRFAAVGK
jgi:hypothetical protein